MNSKVTYRQQYTRCGKQRCRKCREGEGHGPYWYAYWSENGRTVSKYIGTQLPSEIEKTWQAKTENKHSSPDLTINNGKPILRIYLLGQFRVERRNGFDWRAVTSRIWQRRRARVLLGCLLSSSGRQLGREQAMEALWPDLDIETAANRLNGAVHELRQILEPEIARPANSRMLRLERDVLKLADRQQIWVDAEEFEDLLNEANSQKDPERTEQLLEEAAALYSGDYLPEELYAEWAGPRREALRRRWMGLLLNLAEIRAARGALANAIEPLDRLLSTDPTHETAVRHLMLLLTQLDRRGEALRIYHRLANMLQRDYDSEPLPETHELYEALRKGHMRTISSKFGLPGQDKATNSSPDSVASPHAPPIQGTSVRPTFQSSRYKQNPFIGRERELSMLREALLQIEQKDPDQHAHNSNEKTRVGSSSQRGSNSVRLLPNPHFLLLMGETGIGKTRLAEELSQEAQANGWSIAWSRANEQEGTIPYRPWIEILRSLLALFPADHLIASLKASQTTEEASHTKIERLSALLPELRSNLSGNKHYLMLPPEQERLHLWEATVELLHIISQKAPLLLVLDDIHWTDDSSLDLLAYLARHLQGQRILLVGTCRDGEMTPIHGLRALVADLQREQVIVTIPLQPLTQSQIGSLVSHLPEDIVHSIQTQAGGNPLFAEELARYSTLHFPGPDDPETQPGPLKSTSRPLPDTITSVLDRRLSKLSPECQALLGKAAVLGGSFELNLLLLMTNEQQEASNEDTLLDLLEEALRAGLITEEGTGSRIIYHFWHPLIVSHLYERQSAARRAQMHRRAAQTLIQLHQGNEDEVATAITHHLSKGGNNTAKFAHYAEIAGDQAYAIAAYPEAQYYYRQAIQAISEDLLPTLEGNTAPLSTCVTLKSVDPLHLARILERVAEGAMIQGNYEEARNLYQRVLELRTQQRQDQSELARQHEAQIQALIWREIGRTWTGVGEYARGHECFQQGKSVLHEVGVTEGTAWAGLHLQDGVMCCLEGNYADARQYAYEALEMLERPGHRPRLETPSQGLQTLTARTALGNPLEIGRAHELIGVVSASVGQLTDALEHLHTALEIFEKHDLVMAVARVCGNIGAVHAMKTERAEAQTYLKRSYDLAERMGDLPNMAFVMGNIGETAARAGDLLEAENCFKQSLDFSHKINDREHSNWCHVALATTLLDQGKMQEVGQNLLAAFAIGRTLRSSKSIATALISLGDFRIIQALMASGLPSTDGKEFHEMLHISTSKRLLMRARSSLNHALKLDGLEAEALIEGELLLARVSYLFGETEAAYQQTLKILEEATRQELTRSIARSQRLLGSILADLGREEQARQYFEQAYRLFDEYNMRMDYARTLSSYGFFLVRLNNPDEQQVQRGLKMLHEAHNIFTTCNANVDRELTEHRLHRFQRQKPDTSSLQERPQIQKKIQRESKNDRQHNRVDNFAAAGTDAPRD